MAGAEYDVAGVSRALRQAVRGEVRFDDGSRALYATDASNYRQLPIGVVIPRDPDDVMAAFEVCRRFDVPVLPRGGGTSLAGQCCNVAVVLDFSKDMNRLLELNSAEGYARVQPGLVLDELRDAAELHHLTFAPDPSTHNHCTLGGMIGNNSCGVHSVTGGNTVDNILELDVLTYDGLRLRVGPMSAPERDQIIAQGGRQGQIYANLRDLSERYADQIRARYPKLERRVSGYNLDQLLPENDFNVARALVGTEGTCVAVLQAKTRLVYSPPARSLLVVAYPDVYAAGSRVMEILAHHPLAVEGLDDRLIDGMKQKGMAASDLALLPDGGAWLFVEFGGETKAEADATAYRVQDALGKLPNPPAMRVFDDPRQARAAWAVRQAAPRAAARMPGQPDFYDGWEDTAVPPPVLGEYLRDLRTLFDRYDYSAGIYGHFGQGCIHTRINFDLKSDPGRARFRSFVEDAADLVVTYGGSLSGEHGDGQARGELLPRMFGDELVQAFREFKAIWDPRGRMNPGKVVDPYRVDENLRLPVGTAPLRLQTRFAYAEDEGSFPLAMERCIGIGECRRLHGGTMCPSYRATLEEQHSTRGRARMLFEMLHGEPATRGWQAEAVKDALDLCLACKGCKTECPANVDMATYKAEFLSHYYEGHPRPRSAHALGQVARWSRLAARAPSLVNLVMKTPLLGDWAKRFAGVAPERSLPAFASETFVEWFRRRQAGATIRKAGGRTGAPPVGHSPSEAPRVAPGLSALPGRISTQPGPRPHPSPLPEGEGVGAGLSRSEEPSGSSASGTPSGSGAHPSAPAARRVLLWPDTFNNYFHPETAKAAVEVLEHAGFEVAIPAKPLCCGRPLYDYGNLDQAERALHEIIDVLGPYLKAGVPIVGLEPSCVAVFRDELPNLLPDDEGAKRLSQQAFLLSEFLQKYAADFELPTLEAKALVHVHCHHKALMGASAETAVLTRMGVECQLLDDGCCGMAGAFGFEAEHYDVSMKIGEQVLLPAVRAADYNTMIVADGFSCREQIAQGTQRHAVHLAEVIQFALRKHSRR
jgi:FAD/FMN-containing dehydrogenase/Fe-S oxidoreductase